MPLWRVDHSSRGVYRVWCLCDHVASIMSKQWPTRCCCAIEGGGGACINVYMHFWAYIHINSLNIDGRKSFRETLKRRIKRTGFMSGILFRCLAVVEIIQHKGRHVCFGEFVYSCEIWSCRGGVACADFRLKCDAASLRNPFSTFRGETVASKSQQWISRWANSNLRRTESSYTIFATKISLASIKEDDPGMLFTMLIRRSSFPPEFIDVYV